MIDGIDKLLNKIKYRKITDMINIDLYESVSLDAFESIKHLVSDYDYVDIEPDFIFIITERILILKIYDLNVLKTALEKLLITDLDSRMAIRYKIAIHDIKKSLLTNKDLLGSFLTNSGFLTTQNGNRITFANLNIIPELIIDKSGNSHAISHLLPNNDFVINQVTISLNFEGYIISIHLDNEHPNADENKEYCPGNHRFKKFNLDSVRSIFKNVSIYNLQEKYPKSKKLETYIKEILTYVEK